MVGRLMGGKRRGIVIDLETEQWWGSFCETAMLISRTPGSLSAAAALSLVAVTNASNCDGATSSSTSLTKNGPVPGCAAVFKFIDTDEMA